MQTQFQIVLDKAYSLKETLRIEAGSYENSQCSDLIKEIKKLDPGTSGSSNNISNNELIKRLENDFITHFDKYAVEQNKSKPNTDIVRVEKGIWLYIVSLYSHITQSPEKQVLVDLVKLYDSHLYSKEGDK